MVPCTTREGQTKEAWRRKREVSRYKEWNNIKKKKKEKKFQKSCNLMGTNKFRLSSMLPSSWFHKLKNMRNPTPNPNPKPKPRKNTTSSHTPTKKIHPQFTSHRHSYYITSDRLLHNSPIHPPRKSTKRNSTSRRRRNVKSSSSSTSGRLLVASSASGGFNCRAALDSVLTQTNPTPDYSASRLMASPEANALNSSVLPEFGSEADMVGSWSSSCSFRVGSFDTDIIIEEFDAISGSELPPILTKPVKFNDMVSEIKKRNTGEEKKRHVVSVKEETIKKPKEHKGNPQTRRVSPYPTGLKLRSNTPRMKCRKNISSTVKGRRKSLSDSFAIVKSSSDPKRDFRESMVEMIVENNISASKDLEELLACYLCLNSDEYHDIIVKVFEQIWFDLTDIQL